MPFAIGLFAILLVVSGLRETEGQLGSLLKGDFIGQNGQGATSTFLPWIGAIVGIGSLGYISALKKPVDLLLTLLLIVLVLDKNNGVFTKISQVLTSTTSATTVGVQTNDQPSSSSGNGSGSSGNSAASTTSSIVSMIGPLASLAALA